MSMFRRRMMMQANKLICGIDFSGQPDNELWYITTDNSKIDNDSDINLIGTYGKQVGLQVVSHTYENGLGKVRYNAPLERLGENVFQDTAKLQCVSIPRKVTSVAAYCFCYSSAHVIENMVLLPSKQVLFNSAFPPNVKKIYIQPGCSQYYNIYPYSIIEKKI